jgi:hypothetical protein
LGRVNELSTLHSALSEVGEGRRRTVLIAGLPGMGKTTLLEGFLAEMAATGASSKIWVARGQCVEHHGAGEPYLPIFDAIGQLGRSEVGPVVVSTLRRFAPLWLQQLPGLLEPESERELEARTRGATPGRMLREMTEALEELSRERTLVLALEDLHWSDASTCALVTSLARRRQVARLLIVATLRSDEAPEHLEGLLHELRAHARLTEVPLQPLAESTVRDYVVARLPDRCNDPGLIRQIFERTQGHPLFVARVVDGLRDGDPELPETLLGFAMTRLRSLPIDLRETAEVASVAGSDFSVAAVAAGLELELEEAERRCSLLSRRAQLVEANGASRWPDGTVCGRYRHCYELLRQAIYSSLEKGRRAHLHRVIARKLEQSWGEGAREIASVLLHHFRSGHDAPSALRYAQHAARSSSSRHAPRETIQHLEAALALSSELDQDLRRELELRIQLGPALRAVRGWRPVRENYLRVRELALQLGETDHLISAVRGLVACHHVAGEHELARAVGDQLLKLCAPHSGLGAAQAHQSQVVSAVLRGDPVRALDHASRAITDYRWQDRDEHAQRFGGINPAVSALAWSARVLWRMGFADCALECARLGLAVAEVTGDPLSGAFAAHALAVVLHWSGYEAEARAQLEAVLSVAQREDSAPLLWLIEPSWIEAHVLPGDPAGAAEQLRAVIARSEETGTLCDLPSALCLLAEAEWQADQLLAASRSLDRARDVCAAQALNCHLPQIALCRARWALGSDPPQLAAAEHWLGEAIEAAREQHALSDELRASLLLASEPLIARSPGNISTLLAAYAAFDEGFTSRDLRHAAERLRELGVSLPARAPSARRGLMVRAWSVLRERGRELSASATTACAPTVPHAANHALEPTLLAAASDQSGRFVREGEFWTVQFAGRTVHVKDSRGIGLLVQLLAAPRQELHVLELAADRTGAGEARVSRALAAHSASSIDRQARFEYMKRGRELELDIDQARADNDLGRLERLERELEFLTRELSRSYGLSGCRRASGTPAERARVNVTRAIKSATQRIAGYHPGLADHLSRSVRTGTFCVYAPDSTQSWHIERAL